MLACIAALAGGAMKLLVIAACVIGSWALFFGVVAAAVYLMAGILR